MQWNLSLRKQKAVFYTALHLITAEVSAVVGCAPRGLSTRTVRGAGAWWEEQGAFCIPRYSKFSSRVLITCATLDSVHPSVLKNPTMNSPELSSF